MKFKAQGLVELGLVFAFVAIIAIALFTPIGEKIQNALEKMSPQKTASEQIQAIKKIENTIANNVSKLANSDNASSEKAASFINDTMKVALEVASGSNSSISNENAKIVASAIKKDSSIETSGSLASIISFNVNKAALSNDEAITLDKTTEILKDIKISVGNTSESLTTSINNFVASLSGVNESTKKSLLNYDMSPVNETTDIDSILATGFKIDKNTKTINTNVINSVLLAENVVNSNNPNATTEIKKQAQAVLDSFKAILKIK